MPHETRLGQELYDELDERLAPTDELLATGYPGDDGSRQPIHTVYVPADTYDADLPAQWGQAALETVETHGGFERLCETVGIEAQLAEAIIPLVQDKLSAEPIEDLRVDFEDGFRPTSDAHEDDEAVRCGEQLASAVDGGPPFSGLRFKSLEAATRERGLRTLDLFLQSFIASGGAAEKLTLTLPKVTTVDQVEAMVEVCVALERAHGLEPRTLRFEVQVETPQVLIGSAGTVPVAALIHHGDRRVTGLHYGTYDYSAALQISPQFQSMEHPAADLAKGLMQIAAAETGVRLSEGSTNILPVGTAQEVEAGWALHARLVTRSLERGFYQGWDLHPAQLPTRFLATYAFYRRGFATVAQRLGDYASDVESGVLDEPATARALSRYLGRGMACGALSETEVETATGLRTQQISQMRSSR